MKKAFTLAEIMIVLAVIGVLTAILLPVAFHSTPDENVMKFKKGHNALLTVVRELVNSDQYYLEGDLSVRANGVVIDGTHDGDYTYLCNTIADIMDTKSVDCSEDDVSVTWMFWDLLNRTEEDNKTLSDQGCKDVASEVGPEIVTTEGIVFYQTYPKMPFGYVNETGIRNLLDNKDDNGFIASYKTFCMDIDGIDEGEDPFAYGIRVDGKVIFGARAEEWLQKSIQQ